MSDLSTALAFVDTCFELSDDERGHIVHDVLVLTLPILIATKLPEAWWVNE
jgi:hypothetical protein